MKNNREKIRSIAFVSIFVAMMCVVSQIAIPMPSAVPITLQALMIALAGYYLGVCKGLISVFAYTCIGAIGIPVFSGFKGGIYVLFGPTGGFIWGFLIIVLLCGISANRRLAIPIGILSVILCHLAGVFQYMVVSRVTFFASLISVSLPYIIKDIILVVLAYFIAVKIKKILNKEVEK